MLSFDDVEIAYDDWRLTADFTLPAGSATALIGPSGAGKSTLLGLVAGFLAPRRGRVLWQGRDITGLPPADRPVTLLFQEHNLFPQLSVARNVALGLRPDLRLNAAGWEKVSAALAEVGLAGMERRPPAQLSGGQRQRVALARALLRARPILLLDEPFAALGPALRGEMLDLVARIRAEQDLTLLMVTHEAKDALRVADQTVLVMDGAAAPPAETRGLFADPPRALREYLG